MKQYIIWNRRPLAVTRIIFISTYFDSNFGKYLKKNSKTYVSLFENLPSKHTLLEPEEHHCFKNYLANIHCLNLRRTLLFEKLPNKHTLLETEEHHCLKNYLTNIHCLNQKNIIV